MFSKTQNQRIRDELILMLREENPIKAILRMKELHELRFIHQKIRIKKNLKVLFKNIKETYGWYSRSVFRTKHIELWLIYLMALVENLNALDIKLLCEEFVFTKNDKVKLISCGKHNKNALKKLSSKSLTPSKVYSVLKNLSLEEILFLRAKTKNKIVLSNVEAFLAKHDKIKIKLGGEDLKKLGLKPGPVYANILREVLHNKIDGKFKTKEDELKFVKRSLK